MRIKYWIGIGIALCSSLSYATPQQALPSYIDSLLAAPALSRANIGLDVRILTKNQGGKSLYQREATQLFAPASCLKLMTTAAVMKQKGADYRFKTKVGYSGQLGNGKLKGDLWIIPSGDPSLSARFHQDNWTAIPDAWADSLLARGIKKITGNIVIVDTILSFPKYSEGWGIEDLRYDYAAEKSSFSINENMVDVFIQPDSIVGNPGIVELRPQTKYMQVINQTKTVAKGERRNSDIQKELGGNVVYAVGRIPIGDMDHEGTAVPKAAIYAATLWVEAIQRKGIRFEGTITFSSLVDADERGEVTVLWEQPSAPLSEIVWWTNKKSVNFLAEQLLLTMTNDYEKSIDKMKEILSSEMQVDTLGMVIVDGCGLSRMNLASPKQLCDVLAYMYQDEQYSSYAASLPIMGVDGTLAKKLTQSIATGKILAKTGTMKRIRNIAGYVPIDEEHVLAFSILCTQFTSDTVIKDFQDKLCEAFVRYTQAEKK